MDFSLDKEKNDLYVNFTEDLDSAECKKIKNVLDGYIIKCQPKKIYLDLSKVNFMDSSGIGLIMGRYKISKMLNTEMVILNPNNKIKKIMSISSIDQIVDIVEDI